MRRRYIAVLVLAVAYTVPNATARAEALPLVFNCARDNDLYRVMTAGGADYPRFDTAAEAISKALQGSGVALLAEGYPGETTPVDAGLLAEAEKKKLRIYVEYPSALPDLRIGTARYAEWERAVVASDAFGPNLRKFRILAVHRCRFVPVPPATADLVLARVAGFDAAVYGLPEKNVYPILFEHPRGDILVATTKLSRFITARYAPAPAWGVVWKRILSWLCPGQEVGELKWTPSVRPSFKRDDKLPSDAELQAFRRGVAWFGNAHLFPPPGDGSAGVMEGLSSTIEFDGSQPINKTRRADCTGEVSMAMAFSGLLDQQPGNARIAANLNDFLYFKSLLALGPRNDPNSPSYGLLGWSLPDSVGVYYGDDNARSMMGTMAASALLKNSRWDERLLRCLLANLRTTGKLGFRRNRLEEAQLQRLGWRHFYNEDRINYAPHYEAYLWACFLWAYDKTHFTPFLERARNAIRMTMEAYPAEWRWTNGMQQERARMLLPLAWLVRVEDTSEHRRWLRRVATDLLALQDESGAIREETGSMGKGSYWPPKSNEEYGTREAPLLQENGDPVSDLLYTSNFAFLGLHEAALATRDRFYADAEEKLAKFLCRIQVRSESHPELDGAWYRAFDYRRWEYWGSSADLGWGAWSVETGWTQAWIASVLGLRSMKTSLWDLTSASRIGRHFDRSVAVMFGPKD